MPWRGTTRAGAPDLTPVLLDLAREHRAARLDWHVDETTTATVWLHADE